MDYDPETAEDDDGDVVVASLPASNALYQPPPQLPSIISINKSKSLIVQKSSAPPIFTYPLQPPPPASVSAPPPPPTEDYIVTDRDQNSKVTISTSIAQKVHNDFEDDRNKLIEAENMKQKALASKHSTTNFISRVKKPIRGFDQDNDSDEEEFHKESEQQQKSSASESNISSVFKPPTSESVSISHVASISPVSAEDLERARNAAAQLANAARLKLQLQLQLQQQQQVADVTSSSYSKESDPNIRKRKSRWGEATSIVPITIPVSTIPPQMCNSVNSPVFASDEERQAWEKRIKEQKELQLLESRIRQAAAQSFTLGRVGAGGGAGNEKENALFQERLKEYEELASRYDEKFRDTIEEAEANNGVIEGGKPSYLKYCQWSCDTSM